jgi:hypothetical protein
MNPITTDYKYNFTKAENGVFSWDSFIDGGGMLHHKPSGRDIYQMRWINENGYMSEPVEGEIKTQAIAFWDELAELRNQKSQVTPIEPEPEPEHGINGYCRKCHSYCYGDCTAN